MREVSKTFVATAFLIFGWGVFLVSFASAQTGSIEMKTIAEKEEAVTLPDGTKTTRRVEATKTQVVPGDIVVYTVFFTNVGKEAAEDIVIKNPVPEHTTYVQNSAEVKGSEVLFSVDGGKTFDRPENLKVKGEDGKLRPAKPSEYTFIMWRVKGRLGPSDKGSVSFKVRIE